MIAEIRPARASDIDALVTIENAVFQSDRISRRSFQHLFRSGAATILVSGAGAAISGYTMVLYRKGSTVARLYSIAVALRHSGSGIGKKLLEAAEQAACERGRMVLRLEVREENERARRFYEKAGYRRIGRKEKYYQDGAAALRFEKLLSGGRQDAVIPGERAAS